jgi:HD-like signal output (HDOD) protein
MDAELIQRIKNCKTLPAIPALPLQVLQMCRSEDADIKKLANLISKDPTFVAKVLNVSNSSFYGGVRHKVTTVTQAITLLGMNSVATLAFCFSLYRDLKKHGGSGFDHVQFWRRSMLASVSGRVVGGWLKIIDREEIFLASLLQDIGILVLSETYAEVYGKIIAEANKNHQQLLALEQQQIGSDHSEVGAWLGEFWQLPELLQLAVRCSHNPEEESIPEEFRQVISCVSISGKIADIWCDPETAQATQEAMDAAKKWHGMEPHDLSSVLEEIASGFLEMTGVFQIDIGNSQEIDETLKVAQEMLSQASIPELTPSAPAS